MTSIIGLDIDSIIDKIGGQFDRLVPGDGNPFAGLDMPQGNPFGNLPSLGAGNPFGGLASGPAANPFAGFATGATVNPFGALASSPAGNPFGDFPTGGGDNPFGSFDAPGGNPFGTFDSGYGNPFGDFSGPIGNKAPPLAPVGGTRTTGATSGGAGSWLGSGTASDNQGLDAAKVDAYIARTRPNSPLVGMGAFILQEANAKGVSVPQLLGITLLESQMGADGSYLPSVNNFGGLTGTGWGGQTGNTTGMARAFATFATKEDGVRALIDNLASDLYRGKSIQQQISLWYLGKPDAGMGEADEQGNATVQQYLDVVGSVFAGLGIGYDPRSAPTQATGAKGGGAGTSSIWGGVATSVTQEIGSTDFSAGNPIYDYGAQYGVSGHTGLDVGMARGTKLYMPSGFSGTVEIAGGTPYFRDEDYGDQGTPGKGEMRVRLDNGWILILGHTSQINVRAGQRLNGNDFVGLSGDANGPHLHLELRIPDPSTPSGFRIVDPRDYLG